MATIAARQIDESIKRFIDENKIRVDRRELELVLSGEHVVDNGVNKAIIDKVLLVDICKNFSLKRPMLLSVSKVKRCFFVMFQEHIVGYVIQFETFYSQICIT